MPTLQTVMTHLRTSGVVLFVAVCSASCATVPDVEQASASAESVRVSSAKGWLSYRQSQQLIQRLGDSAHDRDFLAAHLKVEEAVAGSPLTTGNAVRIYSDGMSTYDAMFEAIENARRYIYLETYIFEGDEIGNRLANMLAGKRAAGVEVAVMVDGIGTLGTPGELFEMMRSAGIKVAIFNPVNPLAAKSLTWSLNKRNHRKILTVDGVIGFTGGINMSDVYTASSSPGSSRRTRKDDDEAPPWRDTHVRIEGPAVAELEKVFVQGWESQNAPELARVEPARMQAAGNEVVRIIANDPGDKDGYGLYLTLMSAISSAQKSIYITMAYFVPDPAFVQALKDAAARGVDVVLVLPAFTDSTLVLHAGRSHYTDLLQAGVKIHERRDALLHAKTAVIDGVWSTVGSSNLDWRSFALNYEVNAVILGTRFGERMQELFAEDIRQSHQVTLDAWEDRGVRNRFMEFLGRLGERWL